MARNETDREDLFAELNTWLCRWELHVPQFPEPIVAGLREDGRFSVYFGSDPVYHFDGENRLLRGFVQGELFRSQGSTLARLRRERTLRETQLIRHDLTPQELSHFLRELTVRLKELHQSFITGDFQILRSETGTDEGMSALKSRIAACLNSGPVLSPAYRGRK